jgi:hypothetical protein
VTQKEREDRFIERCRREFGGLTWESELLLRYGFAAGADELGTIAYASGVEVQRSTALDALGAVASKKVAPP